MKHYCRNCFHPLSYKAKYCAHCGQRDTDGRIEMKSLMLRIWNNTFHLEGKFIRTAWQLFVPGKVTLEFFKGKQDRYPHPIRLFAIVMFLFLFFLNLKLKEKEIGRNGVIFSQTADVKAEDRDTVEQEQTLSTYEQMKYNAMVHDLQEDYTRMPESWKTVQSRNVVDSLLKQHLKRYNLEKGGMVDSMEQIGLDTISLGFMNNMRFATLDLVRYEPDVIIQRYGISDWKDKIVVRQGIKSYKNPDAFVHACIGSLTWAILALVAIMAGFLALLYVRQKRFYVEHFIFLLHFHTGAMLLLLIALIGELIGIWGVGTIGFAAFLPLPMMYMALRKYYGQGRLKTFVKWLLYGVFYFFSFLFLFILGMMVVFATY